MRKANDNIKCFTPPASAGGLAGYSKAMFKHKLNSTMGQITMLVTNIRTHFGTQRNYAALTEERLVNLGIIPPVVGAAGSFKNPFKGAVTITKSHARSTDTTDTAFVITYAGLPKEACISLATADFGSGAGSGFIGVVVGSVALSGDSVNPDVYIGSGNGQSAVAANTTLNIAAQDEFATTRKEGQAYTMSAAITAYKDSEKNVIAWKFY